MNRLLAKLHLLTKIALFGTFFRKFFDCMFTYALKIFQKICSKIDNFFKQSKSRKKSNYYFIGIGGIGMSALARMLHAKGLSVKGSDHKTTPLVEELIREGILIDAPSFTSDTRVVISTAIPKDHPECIEARRVGATLLHRSDVLVDVMTGKQGLLVAGSHGKTTVSSLLAYVLDKALLDPSFAIGGIVKHKKTNGYLGRGELFVAESDESDGSFLKLQGKGLIITNIEKEHMDYWKSEEALIQAFKKVAESITDEKYLVWCADDPTLRSFMKRGVSFGFHSSAAIRAEAEESIAGSMFFNLIDGDQIYKRVRLNQMGKHNVQNCLGVFALAKALNISPEVILDAFTTFPGVSRRLDKRVESPRLTIYDDYAHHPSEIKATLEALKKSFPTRRLVACFQPHRYTRLQFLFEEFVTSFTSADLILITDVYAASEKIIENITGAALEKRVQKLQNSRYLPRVHLERLVAQELQEGDILVTLGAGDVTLIPELVFSIFNEYTCARG